MAFSLASLMLPLRIAQAVFAVVVLGLTGYVTNWWTGFWHSTAPSEVAFLLFNSVWSLLALTYLVIAPQRMPKLANKYGILAAEALTMLFWFAGFIALAVFLANRVCFGSVCAAAKAATAFGGFDWLLFTATTVMAGLHAWRTRGTYNQKADPQMSVQPGV